ncbi:MAG: elongation factor P [Candidatus Ryanbacteria bacterium]|nr:elongation factor P [Candidatus Ryanbacteria bacterium]
MLSYSELRVGTTFILDGDPYKVLEYNFLRMQQRKPVAQTKIKNLRTGKIVSRMFHQNESFQEADIEREKAFFLYTHRGEYWFRKPPSSALTQKRFMLKDDILGDAVHFLVPDTEIITDIFRGEIISIELPIKMDFKVKEAPPGVKGDSAQGGSKEVVLETGYKITVPLFVNAGDVVRINTETGEYVERLSKA